MPAAAAYHGLVVVAHGPGKAQHGAEIVRRVQFVPQVALAEQRRQVLGLGHIVIERVALISPGQPVIQAELRLHAPVILPVEVEGIVMVGIAVVIGRRLVDITDPHLKSGHRKLQDVVDVAERRRNPRFETAPAPES